MRKSIVERVDDLVPWDNKVDRKQKCDYCKKFSRKILTITLALSPVIVLNLYKGLLLSSLLLPPSNTVNNLDEYIAALKGGRLKYTIHAKENASLEEGQLWKGKSNSTFFIVFHSNAKYYRLFAEKNVSENILRLREAILAYDAWKFRPSVRETLPAISSGHGLLTIFHEQATTFQESTLLYSPVRASYYKHLHCNVKVLSLEMELQYETLAFSRRAENTGECSLTQCRTTISCRTLPPNQSCDVRKLHGSTALL